MTRFDLLSQERLLVEFPAHPPGRRGVVLFPQAYALGMASLATHTLYASLNAAGGIVWERAFVDPARDATGGGPLCSLETGTPLRDFDVIAVTSSYELDWPALPAALSEGGVAPLRATRRELRQTPLVIIGGPAVSAAPLPLAAIYDAAYIGEVEPVLPELAAALTQRHREAALEHLAAIPGVFVPEVHGVAVGQAARLPERAGEPPALLAAGRLPRRCARDLDAFDTASVILTPQCEFPNRFLVEIGRGCGRACSFCLARHLYRPLRWRSLSRVMDAVRRGLRHTNDLGLIAAAVSDYPELPALCAELAALPPEVSLSTSSVRLESASDEFLRLLARGGQKTVTFAPEAATERLRAAIGKAMTDDELFAGVARAAAAGLSRVRLYFMIGLPGELPEDREAIPVLARCLTQRFPRLFFRFSVGVFSPRPHTPFELEPLPPLRDLRNWLGAAQRSLRALRRVEVSTDSARWAILQAALSRADDRLGIALVRHEPVGYSELADALEAEGLPLEGLTGRQDPSAALPWKMVDPKCVD